MIENINCVRVVKCKCRIFGDDYKKHSILGRHETEFEIKLYYRRFLRNRGSVIDIKKNAKTDKIGIGKIIKYIGNIKDCFEHFKIESYKDLETRKLSQFAITQIITNIYEVKKNITTETLSHLPEFDKIKIAGARNIASHDYEQVNFRIIFDICCMLLDEKISDELKEVVESVSDGNY